MDWNFDIKPLRKGNYSPKDGGEIDVVHHLQQGLGIFENSVEQDAFEEEHQRQSKIEKDGENAPPYSVFTIFMEDLADASVRLKIWTDKAYKTELRKKRMSEIHIMQSFSNGL